MKLLYVLDCLGRPSETFISDEIIELLKRDYEISILTKDIDAQFDMSKKGKIITKGCDISIIKDVSKKDILFSLFKFGIRSPLEGIKLFNKLVFSDLPRWQIFWAIQALKYRGKEHIHVHFANKHLLLAEAIADLFNISFTFTIHGYDIREMPLGKTHFLRVASKAKKVINVSKNYNDKVRLIGVSSSKLTVVPCGIDIDSIKYKKKIIKQDAPLKLITIARLHPIKRIDLVLEAIANLKVNGIEVHYSVIGDGECYESLVSMTQKLSIEDRVTFKGKMEHEKVPQYLYEADIHVLVSDNESLGMANLEAMAAGMGVIITKVGGLQNTVVNKATGIKIAPDNVQELVEAIAFYHDNRTRLVSFGKSARGFVVNNYSREYCISQLINQFNMTTTP